MQNNQRCVKFYWNKNKEKMWSQTKAFAIGYSTQKPM